MINNSSNLGKYRHEINTLNNNITSINTSLNNKSNLDHSHSIYEANLNWGGRNISGGFGPSDAGVCSELGANRFAFGNPSGITIQYSRDGGSTWTDYGASDAEKRAFVSTGQSFVIGKSTTSNLATTNCLLRVIIDTDKFGIYSILNKFIINVSTDGYSGCYVTIDASLESSPSTFKTFANKVSLSGWSGYNVINTSGIITYGNTTSSQYGLLRFTFGCTGVNTSYAGLRIISLKAFGGMGWTTPSTMARTDHLYSYDYAQNATFPAELKAPTINATSKLMHNSNEVKYVKTTYKSGDNWYRVQSDNWIELGGKVARVFTGTVTFPKSFTEIPTVICACVYNRASTFYAREVYPNTVSTTGFTITNSVPAGATTDYIKYYACGY